MTCICKNYFKYEMLIYQWILLIFTRIMLMTSSLHEVYLITNRYFILKKRDHCIINIKLKFYLPILVILTTFVFVPIAFVVDFNKWKMNGELYHWTWSNIAQTVYFSAYFLSLIFFENLMPLTFLAIIKYSV